ncbi:ATP-binding protein [Flammeovirgaceae bacterium SG7u.111]|nr:ATP-binding protein [Flammeovirgaceae bacterium SG7u.132]WPO36519.1 ATP-binding protein [Flammeovirgaceae bacterium SG7u.111]
MLINPRAVSLLLAGSIALVTIAFLSLLGSAGVSLLVVAGGISFSTAFILIYITLEFLIFKEINEIYSHLEKITSQDMDYERKPNKEGSNNPVRRINEEIKAYMARKEEEIEKLKRLEVYRKEFIADVSHELKTPIFAAQGYVLTLLDGAVDDENVKYKFLKKAAKSLSGLDALVQDLLVLSQIESGVIRMQFSTFDIQDVTLDVFDQLEKKANKKGITMMIDNIREDGFKVKADVNRIFQVMSNLISNAIKYGLESGLLKVHFEETADKIIVSVIDNGPGIAPEHVGRLFERFYRVDKSRSKKQGGTGLGLAIVKHIVEGHDSRITIDSKLGEGTTFKFQLEKAKESEKRLEKTADYDEES